MSTEITKLTRFKGASFDKLRGGYYTDGDLAQWMTEWAIRKRNDSVLEPSCGDGSFLIATINRLSSLGAKNIRNQITGVEVVQDEAKKATKRIHKKIGGSTAGIVVNDDFFSWWDEASPHSFDVVVGNPPFIRYQTFPEPHRQRAMKIMARLGLKANQLTNIWVPFVAASIALLKPGGRLALVLPAELLQVGYAAQIRTYLAQHFSSVNIVTCNELFFDNAEQEVVLLMADGALVEEKSDRHCKIGLTGTNTVSDLLKNEPVKFLNQIARHDIHNDREKWLKYFLSPAESGLMRALRGHKLISTLSHHASVDVGVVTGKNEFFIVNAEQVEKFKLHKYVTPVAARASHLSGAVFRKSDWKTLSELGDQRVYLLDLRKFAGETDIKKYIKFGEISGFQSGYKCSLREPWYVVPSIWEPNGFLFRQIHDFPRAVLNRAGATSSDTIHRLEAKKTAAELIPHLYTHLTGASAEIEGRSYGGGVLELEPTEAERLLVPAELSGAMPIEEIDKLIRLGRLNQVLEKNDELVLIKGIGLSVKECKTLANIWSKMRSRRQTRKTSHKRVQLG